MSKPALLIVDMMNLFDFPNAEALGRDAVPAARAIARMRARFDSAQFPVIYANDNFMQWRGEFQHLIAACRAAGGVSEQLADLLAPGPGHYYVLKPKNSAFLATALPVLLTQQAITQLAIVGLSAHSCVLATALDANMRGLEAWVPSDCTASDTPPRKRAALALLRASNIDTRPTRRVRGLFPAAGHR